MPTGGGWKTGEGGTGTAVEKVSSWLDRVPGYRGYRAKEDRRDADRRVRDTLSAELGARAARVETVARSLANERRLSDIAPVDELARTIRHLSDRVRSASYGYGGLFSDRDVDEAALGQLRQFDESLLAGVADLDKPIAALEEALASGGDLAAAARAATIPVKQAHARLDLRGRVIESGEAAPQESVEALLQPAAESSPPPAFHLGYRDAIAIMGDNFVVDARIDIASQDSALRLFRLGVSEPERWLLVPRDPALGLANLEAIDAQPPGPGQTTVAGKNVRELATGSGDGELSTGERASGRRAVAFRLLAGTDDDPARRALILDWGNETRAYVGKEVHPADIEIFGRAAS